MPPTLNDLRVLRQNEIFREIMTAAMVMVAVEVHEDTTQHEYARNTAANLLNNPSERQRFLDGFIGYIVMSGVDISGVVSGGTVNEAILTGGGADAVIMNQVRQNFRQISNVPDQWQVGWPTNWRPGMDVPDTP